MPARRVGFYYCNDLQADIPSLSHGGCAQARVAAGAGSDQGPSGCAELFQGLDRQVCKRLEIKVNRVRGWWSHAAPQAPAIRRDRYKGCDSIIERESIPTMLSATGPDCLWQAGVMAPVPAM